MRKLSKWLSLFLCVAMALASPLTGLADELSSDAVEADSAVVETAGVDVAMEEEPAEEESATEEPAAEKTAAEEPTAEEPAAEEPAVEEPAEEEPAAEEPALEEPAEEEPTAEEPAEEEPTAEEPAVEEPTVEEPAAEEPAEEEPVVEEPAAEEPTAEKPAEEESAAEESAEEEPTAEEPAAEEPALEEPTLEEPIEEEPAVEEPAVEESTVEEPAVEEPTVEEPIEEEPAVEEPTAEEPAEEEPAAEEPAEEEPAAEEPAEEEPMAEEPTEEEPTAEEPTEEEPAAEEPALEEPAAEEPAAEEPAVEEPPVEEPPAEEPAEEEPAALAARGVDGDVVIDRNMLDLSQNGWQNEDGHWYYIQGGAKVVDTVMQIDGAYYGFDYNGWMYSDQVFSLYDSILGKYIYYRALPGGALAIGWYKDDWGEWYYYGEGGRAPNSEVVSIGGVSYAFDALGRLFINGMLRTGPGQYYATDAGGRATAISAVGDGWRSANGEWYYAEGGELVNDTIVQVGDKLYGFGGNYQMYRNQRFYMSYPYPGVPGWRYASEDGSLYVNRWYQDGNGDWFYYGGNGVGPSSTVVTIGGTPYVFGDGGWLQTSGSVEVGGVCYIADARGVAHAVSANGWLKIDDDYYYVKDGQPVTDAVMQIGGKYYGFSYSGQMYANTSFMAEDPITHNLAYYRASADGSVYTCGWYRIDGRWYYGDAQGVAPSFTVKTIGGTQYVFGEAGELQTSGVQSLDGKVYIADSRGVAHQITAKGWIKVDGEYYYSRSGSDAVHDEVLQINGTYYGFDASSRLYTTSGCSFYACGEDHNDHTFRVRSASGALCVNEWYRDGDTWYYYGAGGVAADGLVTLNGKTYLFINGMLNVSAVFQDGGNFYLTDENGVATKTGTEDGWKKAGGSYYYFKGGYPLTDTVRQIGGKYYGFDVYSRMLDNETAYVSVSEGEGAYVRAMAGGQLYRNAWYQDGEAWYYYDANCAGASGAHTVGGKLYVFYNDGQMRRREAVEHGGRFYIINDAGVAAEVPAGNGWKSSGGVWAYVKNGEFVIDRVVGIGGAYYGFDYSGFMQKDTDFAARHDVSGHTEWAYFRARADGTLYTNQWYQSDEGDWYHYGPDGATHDGIVTLGGRQYAFGYDGQLLYEGAVYDETGKTNYVVDKDGIVHSIGNKDGWAKYDDHWYYIKDGMVLTETVIQVGGAYYGFDELGMMYTNWEFGARDDASGEWGWYRARESGALYTGWFRFFDGTWYYYNADGRAADGIQTVGGVQYGFWGDGQLAIDAVLCLDGAFYTTDGKGVATFAALSAGDGWKKIRDNWYYMRSGGLLRNVVAQIGSDFYAFDYDGRLINYYDGYAFWMYNDEEGYGIYYRLKDASGRLVVNSWYQPEGSADWYYYGAGGRAAQYLTTVNGRTYGFDDSGLMIVRGGFNFEEGPYYMSATGIAARVPAGDGWKQYGGDWLYMKDGALVTGQLITVAGKAYGFDSYGVLCKDTIFGASDYRTGSYGGSGIYRALPDGTLYTGGWYRTEWNTWYYFTASGKALTGIKTVNGKVYGFDESGEMIADGMLNYHGTNYLMNAGGLAVDSGTKDGWRQSASEWFYVKNGKTWTYRWIRVGGKYYYFSQYGRMTDEQAA